MSMPQEPKDESQGRNAPLRSSREAFRVMKRLDIPYQNYIRWQDDRVERRKRDEVPDMISIITFSNSVYTATSTSETALLDTEDEVVLANRGGGYGWHGPGQVLACPVVRLTEGFAVDKMFELLEAPVLRVLSDYGVVPDEPVEGAVPGIMVNGKNISQLALHLDERVTSYGISLNVTCDLSKFDAIDPCGVKGRPVTNLAAEANREVHLDEVVKLLADYTSQAFRTESS